MTMYRLTDLIESIEAHAIDVRDADPAAFTQWVEETDFKAWFRSIAEKEDDD
jgi:hypothetical protein